MDDNKKINWELMKKIREENKRRTQTSDDREREYNENHKPYHVQCSTCGQKESETNKIHYFHGLDKSWICSQCAKHI